MIGIVGGLRQAGRKAAQQACKGRFSSSGEINKATWAVMVALPPPDQRCDARCSWQFLAHADVLFCMQLLSAQQEKHMQVALRSC